MRRPGTISALTTSQGEVREMVESLRRQLQEAEALAAVDDSAESLCSLSSVDSGAGSGLGPTIFAEKHVNRFPAKTLVDTGTIIMLDFVMGIMNQTPQQWKTDTLRRLSTPSVSGSMEVSHLTSLPRQHCNSHMVITPSTPMC